MVILIIVQSFTTLTFSCFTYRPDSRVTRLIRRMGAPHPEQKRILCMNKVDLVEKKKDLLEVAEQFKDLPGFDK
jgi:GTP-binding protein Era